MEVCIIKDTMGIAWNNELKFQSYINIHHFKRRSTCQMSFNMAFFMKDDVKIKVPNKTPKILIPLDGVVN